MAHVLTPAELAVQEGSIWDSIPLLNKLIKPKKPEPVEAEAPKGKQMPKAIKCDLCAGLPFEACVYNCPCDAISRRSPEALSSIGSSRNS